MTCLINMIPLNQFQIPLAIIRSVQSQSIGTGTSVQDLCIRAWLCSVQMFVHIVAEDTVQGLHVFLSKSVYVCESISASRLNVSYFLVYP